MAQDLIPTQSAESSPVVKIMRRATSVEDYELYRAGLEWSLVDPIIIDGRQDLKSEARWRANVEPFQHQVDNLITFCRRLPVTLLADDVGLGKTVSAGLIASELISRRRVAKILIVAPKLLGPQWKEELESKFNIPTDVVTGRDLIDADPADEVGAVVTTYHSARLYIERIPAERFQMLVLDEAHKLRNLYGVPTPPQVAQRFRQVLADRMYKYVLMLTATPLQNRLWDLYSLVDLLIAARGHQHPLGAPGMFVRTYIGDNPTQARRLRPEAREQFRSIVYGYMSRVRRGDANLHFPERNVLLRSVHPTLEELKLIHMIAEPIRRMKNRLAQISILQALTSSPHALAAQLENMGRNGTFPPEIAAAVRAYVKTMPPIAKLTGVGALVDQLRRERPRSWRLVVFTHRKETQTTIQAYLEAQGIRVGIINGDSGLRNQHTIARFKCDPPEVNVVVSTEAGSEGVNLQAANVLVNFDLPWNPMIVEQRIGRIQRLASDFANVFVYSVILKGTFEEYVVARLMEKLQMASHAIGDVESLLEASGMMGDADDADSFGEEIRRLVLDSLAGKDVELAVRKAEESIAQAKITLAEQEAHLNETLGSMGNERHKGPRAPILPPLSRSMTAREFAKRALLLFGAELQQDRSGVYVCDLDGRSELITFEDSPPQDERRITQIAPGTQAFDRLVARITQSAVHRARDMDDKPHETCNRLTATWLEGFNSQLQRLTPTRAHRCFSGHVLVNIRAVVAHDSYERLVEVPCEAADHYSTATVEALDPIPAAFTSPADLGVDLQRVVRSAKADPGVAEFCRFYEERKLNEVAAAGDDERRRKKVQDEFTPRLECTVVGLTGEVRRIIIADCSYELDGHTYQVPLRFCPSVDKLLEPPRLAQCGKTGLTAPVGALGRCELSGTQVLSHHLITSGISGRMAIREHTSACSLSRKTVLSDEIEISSVSGKPVARELLETSAVSGIRGEPAHYDTCAFTETRALRTELLESEISRRPYRRDQAAKCAISGKAGHLSEFQTCTATGVQLLPEEAERCEVTQSLVAPGVLVECSSTRKRVLPKLVERSVLSGKLALSQCLVSSSISGVKFIELEGVRSEMGLFCTPSESQLCIWTGKSFHPADVRVCGLTSKTVHVSQVTKEQPHQLRPLAEMLAGTRHVADHVDIWEAITTLAKRAVRGRVRIASAQVSLDGRHLAVCLESRRLFGARVQYAGFLYNLDERASVSDISVGWREKGEWRAA